MKKSDSQLQRDVLDELRWEPSLDESHIAVAGHDGVVTLNGHVNSYSARRAAEKAVKRVTGVQAIANDLEVQLPTAHVQDDTDVAEAVLRALKWSVNVPHDKVKVTVAKGWVTLEGEVDWAFERHAAYQAVRDLMGIRGVTNWITIVPRVSPVDVRAKIEAAFNRTAQVDAKRVRIETEGSKVTLRGTVASWAEHDDAGRAAWAAPGVSEVINALDVEEEAMVFI